MKRATLLFCMIVPAGAAAFVLAQGQSVVDTPHNLSVTGPGPMRAASEEQVCIFCHTPHNAAPIQPLWNRSMPVSAYIVYSSTSLDARPGQPTGASKMCLSCHDGTIALGSVLSRNQVIQMAGGITTLPPGSSNLGTDLSDDHPISFRYDAALAATDGRLLDPALLPHAVKLDANRELQCTTCHDPHNNMFGNFLVMSNEGAALCRTCHQISTTTVRAHEDCRSCHQPHTAPSGPLLLRAETVTATCTACHDGSHPQAKNIASDLLKLSVHDTDSPVDPADRYPDHATCASCHDPHTMHQGPAQAPDIRPNFGTLPGVNLAGATIAAANYEYEVCFTCHADSNAVNTPHVPRVLMQTNKRLQFAPSAISSHPVTSPGHGVDVPSLRPPWTGGSMVYCSDCHGTEKSGSGPAGVHGSNEAPLLVARYSTADFTPESAAAYALCYSCHQRDGLDGILSDRSFPHSVHVRDQRAPCATCHDPHGISSLQGSAMNNTRLINFNSSIVFPDPVTGRLEFRDLGRFAGECYLSCHGTTHSGTSYQQ